jgi:hypothetical protein
MIKTSLVAAGVAVFAGLSMAGAATPVRPNSQAQPGISPIKRLEEIKKHPLTFYVAKGAPDACGEGCDTWIAAEGNFDPGAFDRFRQFLKRSGDRKLPIYFHSTGGLVEPALEIGRMLRKLNMTAGVGITVSQGCAGGETDERKNVRNKDDDCRKLKESNGGVPASLRENGAICASACVFTLIGATTRLVPPSAKLGVHSPLAIVRFSDGYTVVGSRTAEQRAIAKWKGYVEEMGIDAGLMGAVTSVSFEQSRILTRDEIARFKIDTRDFSETRWQVVRQSGNRAVAYKFVVQADGKKEYFFDRTFIVACGNWAGTLLFRYQRDLPQQVTEDIDVVRIDAGDRPIRLGQHLAVISTNAKESRDGFLEVDRFRTAAALKSIDISEISESSTLRFKLSTSGLSAALDDVARGCARR